MSTMRWELSAATSELPAVVPAVVAPLRADGADSADPLGPTDLLGPTGAADGMPIADDAASLLLRLVRQVRLPRPTAVLAPTLPALMLLGLCIAGLSDPPDQPVHGSGAMSRLHVSTQDPVETSVLPPSSTPRQTAPAPR